MLISVIVLQTSKKLVTEHNKSRLIVNLSGSSTRLPDSPHLLQPTTGLIFAVNRTYRDDFAAFIGGCIGYDASENSFEWLGLEACSSRSSTEIIYQLLTSP